MAVDDSKARAATVAYFAERGPKGATPRQVSEHLVGLGLDGDASDRIVDALLADGAVRDAGFRRADDYMTTLSSTVSVAPSRVTLTVITHSPLMWKSIPGVL